MNAVNKKFINETKPIFQFENIINEMEKKKEELEKI